MEHIHPLPSVGAPGGTRVATQLGLKLRRRVTSPKLHLAVVKLSESSSEKHSHVMTNAVCTHLGSNITNMTESRVFPFDRFCCLTAVCHQGQRPSVTPPLSSRVVNTLEVTVWRQKCTLGGGQYLNKNNNGGNNMVHRFTPMPPSAWKTHERQICPQIISCVYYFPLICHRIRVIWLMRTAWLAVFSRREPISTGRAEPG